MQLFFSRGLLISPKRTNALMKGIMRIIGMLPKLTVISKLFGRSVSHARGEERDKMTFRSLRFALSSRLSPFAWKTVTTENACSAGYLPSEIPWIREKCQLISVLLYAFPFVIFSPSLLTCFDVIGKDVIRRGTDKCFHQTYFLTSIRLLVPNLLIRGFLLFWQQWRKWQRYGELHLSFL